MARPIRRPLPPPPEPRHERLLHAVADLARSGPSQALLDALAEIDRAVRLDGEQLGRDPDAAERLHAMRTRLAEMNDALEIEQRRVGRDLLATQAEIQARARYAPAPAVAATLDRRG